jgi:hypothetical protein
MDTYKLVFGSVSTLLDNLLQPVRHTLYHVAQNLAVSHLEEPQPGDLLLQCLQVGGVGVLLQLHLYPAPSSILHPPAPSLENGFTPGGILLANWLLCDRDAPIYTCAK